MKRYSKKTTGTESLSALKESINIFNWQQTCNTFLGVLPSEYCISDGSYCMFDKEFNLSTRLTFSPATENPVLGERIGGSGIFVSRDYIMRRVNNDIIGQMLLLVFGQITSSLGNIVHCDGRYNGK